MAERVRVRRLNDAEGRELQRIVRRGGKSDRSIVKWRRAMVVLASAGGNDVAAIARLVQTSPDRVREMIHRFNDLGMRSLDPQWAGGRPRLITTSDREVIVETAKARPTTLGCPFSHWSIRKLADHLGSKKGRRVRIGRERLRQILIAEGITFQRTKTWSSGFASRIRLRLEIIGMGRHISASDVSPPSWLNLIDVSTWRANMPGMLVTRPDVVAFAVKELNEEDQPANRESIARHLGIFPVEMEVAFAVALGRGLIVESADGTYVFAKDFATYVAEEDQRHGRAPGVAIGFEWSDYRRLMDYAFYLEESGIEVDDVWPGALPDDPGEHVATVAVSFWMSSDEFDRIEQSARERAINSAPIGRAGKYFTETYSSRNRR